MASISVMDRAIESKHDDSLGTRDYAYALSEFIRGCEAPITIGVQGEWGSGKTSLLNMIKQFLEEQEFKKINGKQYYEIIWINTWEHALLKSPEECLLSIVEEIISKISKVDGSYNAAAKAKSALASLAKGALKVGASVALSSTVGFAKGADLADEFLGQGDHNSVKILRESLEGIVNTITNSDGNTKQRFVIFVDDLDRLEPNVAVQILELLKNIFDIDHCVFVLAIDYQVVVKGLRVKFGEQTEENEWEFRAFFDKIIQLPFMMPMSSYDLDKYITKMLTVDIEFFKSKNEKDLIKDGSLKNIVKLTLGTNPRALKRLTNALSLIKLKNERYFAENAEYALTAKQLVFAFICMQISFPKVFELLLMNPDFSNWDNEFANRVTGGPHNENADLRIALNKAMEIHEDDFDEDWEKNLFKIVWLKKWQRSRLVEVSRLLSIVLDNILRSEVGTEHENKTISEKGVALIRDALRMTSVTAVIANMDALSHEADEDNSVNDKKDRSAYWLKFGREFKNTKTVFDAPVKPHHISGYLVRRHPDIKPDTIQFVATTGSTSPLKIETYSGDPKDNYVYFRYLRKFKPEMEEISGGVKFEGNEESNKQQIIIKPPREIKARIKLDDPNNVETANAVHKWMREMLPKLEELLRNAVEKDDSYEQDFAKLQNINEH